MVTHDEYNRFCEQHKCRDCPLFHGSSACCEAIFGAVVEVTGRGENGAKKTLGILIAVLETVIDHGTGLEHFDSFQRYALHKIVALLKDFGSEPC